MYCCFFLAVHCHKCVPYTAKLLRGKTFAVMHKTHHSLKNFCGASGPCHYVLYTANDSRGKLSQLAKKPRKLRKFSPSKVLPYTVCPYVAISYSVNHKTFISLNFCRLQYIRSHWNQNILCFSIYKPGDCYCYKYNIKEVT